MSHDVFSVVGHDDPVHLVVGGRAYVSYSGYRLPDMAPIASERLRVTSTTCRWRCTGAPASAGLEVVDKPVTCMRCIAREDEPW